MSGNNGTAAGHRGTLGVLAHPKDVHCVIYHLFCLLAYGCAFWLWLNPEVAGLTDVWSRLAFVAGSAVMLGWISGVDVGVNFHNHTHRRIFRQRWLNRWFGRLWTFSGGWPSFFWQHSHVVVHHANVLRPTDWTLPRKRPDGSWENFYTYCLLHWPFRYTVHLWKDFREGRGGRGVTRRAAKEFAIFLALWSIPFWIDPVMALGLWLLPHYLANVMVMGPGMYAQHAGCREPSAAEPYVHSNTFTSRFFNATMFNIGYHTEHHSFPLVHWSDLPAFHESMKDDIIRKRGHVVPFGYYRGGRLLSSPLLGRKGFERFLEQHPDYVQAPAASSAAPEDADVVVPGGSHVGR